MRQLRRWVRNTFRSLEVRNYRLYFLGQLVSISGTWMQAVAQDWLVLGLTGRALPVGITTAVQFLPVLLFGLWSGALADRINKRKILLVVQAAMGLLALVLGVLALTGLVRLWMIYVLAFLLGCATAVDNPTRQAFLGEMVGPEHTANAVALNSALFNLARVIGPALAGVIIAGFGVTAAFFLNAVSFLAVLAALLAIDERRLFQEAHVRTPGSQVWQGLRYVWTTPELRSTLLLLAAVTTLGMNFRVILPLLARFTFHGDARAYGALASLFAIGSVAGALWTASRGRPSRRRLLGASGAFGCLAFAAAAAPSLAWEGVLLIPLGMAGVSFLATANATLQTASSSAMRGRVMALYAVVFLGSTPVGGVLVGWLAEHFGPRSGLVLAGISGLAGAVGGRARWGRRQELQSV